MTYRCQKVNLEDKGITGNHFLTELHIRNLHEVSTPTLGFLYSIQYQQTAALGHGFNLQYTWHHRFLREMSLEERLITGDVLHTDNAGRTDRDHLVNQLHGIAMGEKLTDSVHIHDGSLVGIVEGCLHLMLTNFLAQQPCELVIDGMTGTGSDDPTFDRTTNQGHVADDVKQLMTSTFVLPHQRLVLDITDLGSIHVRNFQHVGQMVELLLCHLTLIDNDGVIQVTTLD